MESLQSLTRALMLDTVQHLYTGDSFSKNFNQLLSFLHEETLAWTS